MSLETTIQRKSAEAAFNDLAELRKSKVFQQSVLKLKGDIMGGMDLCYRFNIGDLEWMHHVITHWNGESPLPRNNDPAIYRAKFASQSPGSPFQPLNLGVWKDTFFPSLTGFYGGESEYVAGSPRLRRQSLYQMEDSGARWVTLRFRLEPALSEKTILRWIKGVVAKGKGNSKKSSAKAMVLSLLEQGPARLKTKKTTLYGIAQYILTNIKPILNESGFDVKESQAKVYARAWIKEHKKS